MGENKLDKFVVSYTLIWLNFILIKAGILKKQQELRLLMRNKIYETSQILDTWKQKNVNILKNKIIFSSNTKIDSLYIVFVHTQKVFFWRRLPLIKRSCKRTIWKANKMADFYIWNSSLGWHRSKLIFTGFTIINDKKLQHNFTDAYKSNYIIKSWQTENSSYLIWICWCHE